MSCVTAPMVLRKSLAFITAPPSTGVGVAEAAGVAVEVGAGLAVLVGAGVAAGARDGVAVGAREGVAVGAAALVTNTALAVTGWPPCSNVSSPLAGHGKPGGQMTLKVGSDDPPATLEMVTMVSCVVPPSFIDPVASHSITFR